LATSQNPLKKPQAAPVSLAACRMDKLGGRKKKTKLHRTLWAFKSTKSNHLHGELMAGMPPLL